MLTLSKVRYCLFVPLLLDALLAAVVDVDARAFWAVACDGAAAEVVPTGGAFGLGGWRGYARGVIDDGLGE